MSPAGSELGNLEDQAVFMAVQMSPAGVQILEIWRVRCVYGSTDVSSRCADLGNLEGQDVFVTAQICPAGVQILEIWRVRVCFVAA